jgi:hypothetical protein
VAPGGAQGSLRISFSEGCKPQCEGGPACSCTEVSPEILESLQVTQGLKDPKTNQTTGKQQAPHWRVTEASLTVRLVAAGFLIPAPRNT